MYALLYELHRFSRFSVTKQKNLEAKTGFKKVKEYDIYCSRDN